MKDLRGIRIEVGDPIYYKAHHWKTWEFGVVVKTKDSTNMLRVAYKSGHGFYVDQIFAEDENNLSIRLLSMKGVTLTDAENGDLLDILDRIKDAPLR